MNTCLRPHTVKLLSRLMRPLVDEGIILVSEEQAINSNLKHLSAKGTLAPSITPKLIDQKEAAEMLRLGFSNFKKLESAKPHKLNRQRRDGIQRRDAGRRRRNVLHATHCNSLKFDMSATFFLSGRSDAEEKMLRLATWSIFIPP